jgi:aspartyl-tRNA(Asn)/glutamyl-tRNA(Gln) amidotransferase subunit C
MEVTNDMVANLAHLARLRFKPEQQEEIKNDLQKMIAFVEKLNEIDTTGVKPMLFVGNATNVLREDEIKGSITREEALQNAPMPDTQFFKVPKVISK